MTIAQEISADWDDPESEFNTLRILCSRLCDRLGLPAGKETSDVVCDHLLRALWLGQGQDRAKVLSDPILENVIPMPGVVLPPPSNVVDLNIITAVDIPIEKVLAKAGGADLTEVIVIGWKRDGELFHSASFASGPEMLWMLKLTEKHLLEITDTDIESEGEAS